MNSKISLLTRNNNYISHYSSFKKGCINYPIVLNLINLKTFNYVYYNEVIQEFKLNNPKIIAEIDRLTKIILYDFTFNLIDLHLLKKGILSDRDLIKNNLFQIDQIKDTANLFRPIKLYEIFRIQNKFEFFYEFFRWHTIFVKSLGFYINNNSNNIRTAVIVETRNHILLEHIIYNIMFNLGNSWNLHIFCGLDNHNYINSLFPDNNIKITILPFYNLSVDLYDFIFLNKFFWEDIDTEDILIFQTDTYLVNNPTNLFENNYGYFGAAHRSMHFGCYLTPNGFGLNGGFSFRKKSIMISCINNITVTDIDNYRLSKGLRVIHRTNLNNINDISSYNNVNTDLIYEDVFFSHAIEMLNYEIPPLYIVKKFIIQEDLYGLLYDVKGVHGWDKNYIDISYHKKLLKKYISKQLIKYNKISKNNIAKISVKETKILIVCHDMKGGTEKYVQDVINLNKNNNTKYDMLRITGSSSYFTSVNFNNNNITITEETPNFLYDEYDVIHIHFLLEHTMMLSKFLLQIINLDKSKKVIITIHDYHMIVNDKTNDYHLTIHNSDKENLTLIKNNSANKRKFDIYRQLYFRANILVTGSFLAKQIYNYIFDLPESLIKVAHHPEPDYSLYVSNPELDFSEIRIGVIGAIGITKGSYMIQKLSLDNFATFHHFGYGFNKKGYDPINLIEHGAYSNETELFDLIRKNKINILWYPAFRHESYCYTLTLGMATKLPILAYDSGTFKERLAYYDYPYKIHRDKYDIVTFKEDIIQFFNDLKNDTFVQEYHQQLEYDDIDYNYLYEI
jgi:hypothetical protein